MKLVFATGNRNKLREISMMLEGMDFEIVTMKEAGIDIEIDENGTTFSENAMIKAKSVYNELVKRGEKCFVMSDDSGLEIDALNKEPGIYSARYMGEDTSYHIKNQNLIDRLEGVPDEKRTARFVCAMALILPDGSERETLGVMEGRIGYKESGENGFGYDPIFILPKYGCTTADLAPEVKNAESHRGKALRDMYKILCEIGGFQH